MAKILPLVAMVLQRWAFEEPVLELRPGIQEHHEDDEGANLLALPPQWQPAHPIASPLR